MSQSWRSGRQHCQFCLVHHGAGDLSPAELNRAAHDTPQYGLLQKQSNPAHCTGPREASTATEIHAVLVTPISDRGGQLYPLLIPHTQPCVPLKPGFWKGTLQASLLASSKTQCGFSLLSASRSHLCSKVGWSTLDCR